MRRLAPLLLDSTPLALRRVGVFNLRTHIYKQQPQTAGVLCSFHDLDLCKHLPNHGENAGVPWSPGLKSQPQPHSPAAGEAEGERDRPCVSTPRVPRATVLRRAQEALSSQTGIPKSRTTPNSESGKSETARPTHTDGQADGRSP